jgi:predicted protein tyrosine phosphatase
MKIGVCALDDVAEQARLHRPAGVVSLLAPGQAGPILPPPPLGPSRLTLRFHDIPAPRPGLVAPDGGVIISLLKFAGRLAPDDTLLIHCWLGISRSPAAAFVLACALAPDVPELAVARTLRGAAPGATPNPLLARLADDHLGRDGRMLEALSRIGDGVESQRGAPFMLDTLRLDGGRPDDPAREAP